MSRNNRFQIDLGVGSSGEPQGGIAGESDVSLEFPLSNFDRLTWLNGQWTNKAGAGHVLSDLTARNAIPDVSRYDGMEVYIQSTDTNYQLQGGIANTDWVDLSVAIGDVDGGTWT